jgi:hypothetical protein
MVGSRLTIAIDKLALALSLRLKWSIENGPAIEVSKYTVSPTSKSGTGVGDISVIIFIPSALLDAKNLDVCCDINCVDGVVETVGNIGNPNKLSSYIYPLALVVDGAAPSPFTVLILLYRFTSSIIISAILFIGALVGEPLVGDIRLFVPLLNATIDLMRKASPLPEPSVLIYIPGLISASV